MSTAIVWFQDDLRLADHPALHHAAEHADTVVPVYIQDPTRRGELASGEAWAWWRHQALKSLQTDLADEGMDLVIRQGPPEGVLLGLVEATQARVVAWNRRHDPRVVARDRQVAKALAEAGTSVPRFLAGLLHDPASDQVRTGTGDAYRTFTPFWRRLQEEVTVAEALAAPSLEERAREEPLPSDALEDLALAPEHGWSQSISEAWQPTEAAGHELLDTFLGRRLLDYEEGRDRPDLPGTSRLSPYLAHGQLSPRQIWQAVTAWAQNGAMWEAAHAYLRQLGWREFAYHVLTAQPETRTEPMHTKYEAFPWHRDPEHLAAWQRGQTGYPIVDAGMRELWQTGWMHNRVRMIVASFLTKDLMIAWQDGQAWFRDTLVDHDPANNTLGWQWAAGCGADAQPFFRIFNPVSQGQRHDPDGAYVRRWVPELADLPTEHIHAPWKAPEEELYNAGIRLGVAYPEPMVDHSQARQRALDAYEEIT